MANKVIDNQCPSCNAPLFFNATLGKFKCEYCDSEFTIEDLNKKNVTSKEEEPSTEVSENYVSYNCPDCGAQIIADEHTASTFCLYCGNAAILKNKLSGKFAPNSIILFKTEKERAIEAFKGLSKGRPLMPKTFNSEKNIEKITGLYVPFWLFDITVAGSVEANAEKVKTWTSGNTHYTKRDYYKLYRTGSMLYDRIPVDGSTRFNDDIMNTLEPFNYGKLVPYNHAYLSGYLSEKYDIESDKAIEDAKSRALSSGRDLFLENMRGNYSSKTISSNTLEATEKDHKYALLPVWMVNVKYKDKFYLFAMNGQTGEFVGDVPLDIKKTIIVGLSIFAATFIILLFGFFMFFIISGGNL